MITARNIEEFLYKKALQEFSDYVRSTELETIGMAITGRLNEEYISRNLEQIHFIEGYKTIVLEQYPHLKS